MLFHHKKRSLFPLILALLTLGLIGLMILSFSGTSEQKQANQNVNAPDKEVVEKFEGETVDGDAYVSTMRDTLQGLPGDLEAEPDNLKKLVKIEDALETVLEVKVPADRQSAHLEIALALKQMERGLRNESDAYDAGLEELRSLISNNEWLQ